MSELAIMIDSNDSKNTRTENKMRDVKIAVKIADKMKDLDKAMKSAEHIGKDTYKKLKVLFGLLGCEVVDAPNEADYYLGYLYKMGVTQAGITNDTDPLPGGCDVTIRFEKKKIIEYNLKTILSKLGITTHQFVTICVLMGNESNKMLFPYAAFDDLVKLVKKYKTFRVIISEGVFEKIIKMPCYAINSVNAVIKFVGSFTEYQATYLYEWCYSNYSKAVIVVPNANLIVDVDTVIKLLREYVKRPIAQVDISGFRCKLNELNEKFKERITIISNTLKKPLMKKDSDIISRERDERLFGSMFDAQ